MPSVRVTLVEAVDSTSLYARRLISDSNPFVPAEPFVVRAHVQTDGIGRLGRRWASPRGGLWMTLAWPVPASGVPGLLGLRCAVAAAGAIDACVPDLAERLRIKWPNDLVIGGRKVGGLLVEVLGGALRWVLVGVGVNANMLREALPPDVQVSATTLQSECGHEVHPDALVVAMTDGLVRALTEGESRQVLIAVRERLYGEGLMQDVLLSSGERARLRVLGLADDGRLRVERGGEELLVSSPA